MTELPASARTQSTASFFSLSLSLTTVTFTVQLGGKGDPGPL